MKLDVKVYYRHIDRQGPAYEDWECNDVVYSDSPVTAKEILKLMREKHGLLIVNRLLINGEEVELFT